MSDEPGSCSEAPTRKCAVCQVELPVNEMVRARFPKLERVEGKIVRKIHVKYYCEPCFDKKYVTCSACEKTILKTEASHYGDDAYCEECFDEDFTYCSSCGEAVPNDETITVGDDTYCQSCGENYFQCENCGEMFENDISVDIDGRMFCPHCAARIGEKETIQKAERIFSNKDVEDVYPDIDKRLVDVYQFSILNRGVGIGNSKAEIKRLLPGVSIDFSTFTYVNEVGSIKSLNDIKSPRNSLYKALASQGDAEAISTHIDIIQNFITDAKRLLQERHVAVDKAYQSVKARFLLETNDPRIRAETNALEGTYVRENGGKKYTFHVSKDPVDIIAKTTSQCWESMSCEKAIRGQYGEGPFSDIMHSNLVCFLLDEDAFPIARIMIRWCVTDAGQIDFGLESKWYYCREHPKKSTDFDEMGSACSAKGSTTFLGGMRASTATKMLSDILKQKGKMIKYKHCKTPYVYSGFSDTAQEGKTKIYYSGQDLD